MPKRLKDKRKTTHASREFLVDLTLDPPNLARMEIAEITPALRDYMASIGRKGGKIGGKRRLKTMTKAERVAVAKRAATARWRGHSSRPTRHP